MNKLTTGTLQNIELQEIKLYLKENKDISGFTDFIRDYVQYILRSEDQDTLQKDDFTLMQSYITNLIAYKEVLMQKFPDQNISLLSIEKSYKSRILEDNRVKNVLDRIQIRSLDYMIQLCKTPEEFERMSHNLQIWYSLSRIKTGQLQYLIDLYKIDTLEKFERMCEDGYVGEVLNGTHITNLQYLVNLYKIDTLEKFERMCGSDCARCVLRNIKTKNLQYLINFYKIDTLEKFERMCGNNDVTSILWDFHITNLQYLINLYKIDTLEKFERMCGNNGARYVLMSERLANLHYIIDLYKIDTLEKLERMCGNNGVRYVLSNAKTKNLQYLINFYKIDTLEKFEKMCEDGYVGKVLNGTHITNLQYLIDLYKIDALEKLTRMCGNNNVRYVLSNAKTENLQYLINFCKIDTLEKFEYFSTKAAKTGGLWVKYFNKKNLSVYDFILKNEESREKFVSFLSNKVFSSKHNTQVLFNKKIPVSKKFEKIFLYYLHHKQKSLISMMERLGHIAFFELDIDLDTFRTLDDFRDQDGNIDQKELKKNFEKMMRLNSVSEKNIQKSLNSLENCLRANNIAGIEHLLIENLIEYVDTLYYRKLKIKIVSHLKKTLGEKEVDLTAIEDKKLDNPDFIEVYKMSKNPGYNKQQIQRLLLDYLTGQYDQSHELQQYNTEKNKNWLKNHLTPAQQQVWLAKNREVIVQESDTHDIDPDGAIKENKEIQINNHIEVAIRKIQDINALGYYFQTEFRDKGELKKYYNTVLKKEEESIKKKEEAALLYEDLKFQIDAIAKLDKNTAGGKSQKISSVIIERELDPMKCLMMGNWVDGSCLSFDCTVGNYYSAISNTIDVNKGVYYIRDERGTLLGRCLITLGNDGKISRYKMYYSGSVSAPIDTYFDEYTANLAQKMGMELNGAENNVEEIECDAWYRDGIKNVQI